MNRQEWIRDGEKHGIVTGLLLIVLISAQVAGAQDSSKFLISLRNAENVGSVPHNHEGYLFNGHYFITDRVDLGVSYQPTEPQVIEMPSKIEGLSPSGEI